MFKFTYDPENRLELDVLELLQSSKSKKGHAQKEQTGQKERFGEKEQTAQFKRTWEDNISKENRTAVYYQDHITKSDPYIDRFRKYQTLEDLESDSSSVKISSVSSESPSLLSNLGYCLLAAIVLNNVQFLFPSSTLYAVFCTVSYIYAVCYIFGWSIYPAYQIVGKITLFGITIRLATSLYFNLLYSVYLLPPLGPLISLMMIIASILLVVFLNLSILSYLSWNWSSTALTALHAYFNPKKSKNDPFSNMQYKPRY